MTGKPGRVHIDENGDRYLNIKQAGQLLCGFSRVTLYRWAEAGKTSFGFELHSKLIPTHPSNTHANGKLIEKRYSERRVVLEADILALKEIEKAAGRTEPGPWSPYDRDVLENRADAFIRLQARQKSHMISPSKLVNS